MGLHKINLFVLIFVNFCFAQNLSILNKEFNNTWLLKGYYERLEKGSSVCKARNKNDFEIKIIRFSAQDSTLLIGSLIEGNKESFIIKSENEIYIKQSPFFKNPFSLKILKKGKDYLLALLEQKDKTKDTIFFKPLGNNYSGLNGFEYFINDKSFTGNYYSAELKLGMQFSQDGSFSGYNDFNNYVVDYNPLQNFDVVVLQRIINKRIVSSKTFHWKKVGEHIELYNLTDNTPEAHVKSLFATLKRVK